MLARFHAEVRIARQVSQPNVCRAYDIGELEGNTFLSMEYVGSRGSELPVAPHRTPAWR
jgi:serine/threonine protein kinase